MSGARAVPRLGRRSDHVGRLGMAGMAGVAGIVVGLRHARVRFRARTTHFFRGSRLLSEILGVAFLARHALGIDPLALRLEVLLLACRRVATRPLRRVVRARLAPWLAGERAAVWRDRRVGWRRYEAEGLDDPRLRTSLLLKAPGPGGEKGVLYVSFEYNWLKLLAHHDARRLLAEYDLVGATSASPTDFATLAAFAGLSPDPVFIGVSNLADVAAYGVLAPVVEPVPIMACDWTDPRHYAPRPHAERAIDILLVSNFLPVKRHWVLFQALRQLRRDLRVTLVGLPAPGRGEREIREEARAFGVRQDLEIVTNAPIERVTALQCDARVSVILSRREGSCVAATESMFADSPVAMLANAHVGSRAYINPRTGVLLPPGRVARALGAVVERSAEFDARAWALEHITCFHASARLNAILRAHARRAGRPWTRDIAPLAWRYVPVYAEAADQIRLAPAVERLRCAHGVELVPFVYQA